MFDRLGGSTILPSSSGNICWICTVFEKTTSFTLSNATRWEWCFFKPFRVTELVVLDRVTKRKESLNVVVYSRLYVSHVISDITAQQTSLCCNWMDTIVVPFNVRYAAARIRLDDNIQWLCTMGQLGRCDVCVVNKSSRPRHKTV